MLALIGNIALPELMVIAVIAIIIFGKRLPEVAARAYVNLRRARAKLEDLRRETGIDAELRKIERSVHEATRADLPRLRGSSPPSGRPPIVPRNEGPIFPETADSSAVKPGDGEPSDADTPETKRSDSEASSGSIDPAGPSGPTKSAEPSGPSEPSERLPGETAG